MKITFGDDIEKEIERTVRNFNAKVKYNKNKTRGKGMLPQRIRVQDIKEKYSDKPRAELVRQLRLYQSFGKRNALNAISSSTRLSEWEKDYFEQNLEKTRQFYDKEIGELKHIIGDKPEYFLRQNSRLGVLITKRKMLDKDLTKLSESDISVLRHTFNYAERSDIVKQKGFRLYLDQVERLLKLRGVSKQEREKLLSKFDVLTENEFSEMVRNEDLIDRIYDLVNSPSGRGQYELMVDDANADAIIRDLWNNADDLIAKYKSE